ncbi:MAG: CatB-related O-acetyltransferase [Sphingomonas sp.]|nr:CatB-related O-acetyltransferase [Sphingomonas sp.]
MKFAKLRVTEHLLGLLRKHRISTAKTGERWKIGDVIMIHPDAELENYGQAITGMILPRSLGAFSYSHSPFNPEMAIGRYCSFSWGVELIAGDHPIDWVTTSPVTHNPQDIRGLPLYLNDIGAKEYRLEPYDLGDRPIQVGHDVWVGMRVLIKRGVTIGHGAIVAAGSLVTRDVPPYAIVAGTPARILRFRFPEPLIQRLIASEWWRYGPEKLQPLNPRDPDQFLDRLEEAVAAGLQPLTLPILTGQEIMAAGETI